MINHLDAVTLDEKFAQFDDFCAPRRVAHLNDYVVKIVKVKGDFVWHDHPDTDELFIVHKGSFRMDYRDRQVELKAGDLHLVPKGTEHKPYAADYAELLVLEPSTTVNTGSAEGHELTAPEEPFL